MAGEVTATPMFPLGSVLFPHMPLGLRLFEPRYLKMLGRIMENPETGFGVVLIERGHEVGGGDQRFDVGTMAEVLQVEALEGFMALIGRGAQRFRIVQWLAEDPYPQAEIELVADLAWDPDLQEERERVEALVRRSMAMAHGDEAGVAGLELSDDPVAACWQLAGLTPVSEIDQLRMLDADSIGQLLSLVGEFAQDAITAMELGWN